MVLMFLIVDLLDGIKEFVKCCGDFIVNIVYVLDGVFVCGVVYVFVWDCLFYIDVGGNVVEE